ncbi:MAG: hypothetical protein ND866_24905 [Pyrinomonadaceae bacterium]|nr:hypothetical protein [Pyrinomonadaceae bacterium]
MSIFRELEFNQEWIDLGIVTPAKLIQIEDQWTGSDDKNPEHYRWRAFLDFIQAKDSLDAIAARRLYNLGASDPDSAMGGSIMAHILRRKDCPEDLLQAAVGSKEKFLQKIANEKLAGLEK